MKRALGYISRAGAALTQPRTPMKLLGQVALKRASGKEDLPASARESVDEERKAMLLSKKRPVNHGRAYFSLKNLIRVG